jgi:hypothetical protein
MDSDEAKRSGMTKLGAPPDSSVFKPGDYNVDALRTPLDQVIAWSTALATRARTATAAA